MNDLPPDLIAALIHTSRTSLEKLAMAPCKDFQRFQDALRKQGSATDPAPMHFQNLQSLTLRILDPSGSCLDYAKEILNLASTSNLAALDVAFSLDVLHRLLEHADNPSLRLFEQSIARFAVGRTNVSFSAEHWRKNRDAFWATPFFAKAFPMLYGQGKLKVSSQ